MILAFFVATSLGTACAAIRLARFAGRDAAWRVAGVEGAWLAITLALAAGGVLAFGTKPPKVPLLALVSFAACARIAFSSFGARLATAPPLAWLVGIHAFRIPVELFLHWGHGEGFVPIQMTWEGRNGDILTGLSAAALAWAASRGAASRALVLAWNCLGLGLLINIVVVAILSMPTPLRVFLNDPPNAFVAQAPYVWLPAFLVQIAWLGHLLVFRRVAKGL